VQIGLVGQAIVLFAATNVDDMVMLSLFFGLAVGRRGIIRVVVGQYLGFAAILLVSVVGALGAGLLPATAIPYLGLLPLLLGLRAAWMAWRGRGDPPEQDDAIGGPAVGSDLGPGVIAVAAVTLSNGGDNIGAYVPVFAETGVGGLITYVTVFLVLVVVWCAAAYYVASRPMLARALSRWGHVLLPVVLIGIGLVILIEGHAFGL